MTKSAHTALGLEIAGLIGLEAFPGEHVGFIFEDLASEAAYAAIMHGLQYRVGLNEVLNAFRLEFLRSGDIAKAQAYASARLEALARDQAR